MSDGTDQQLRSSSRVLPVRPDIGGAVADAPERPDVQGVRAKGRKGNGSVPAAAGIRYFEQVKKIIRTAQSGQPVGRALDDLALLLEAEAEITHDSGTIEQAMWLRRRAQDERKPHQPTGPTAETVKAHHAARLDPVEAMRRRGGLRDDDLGAIEMIRRCFDVLTRGLDVQAMALDAIRVDNSTKPLRDPADRMSIRSALMLRHVFRPWAARVGGPVEIIRKLGRGVEFVPLTPQERRDIRLSGGTMDAPLPFTYTEDYYRSRWRHADPQVTVGKRALGLSTFELVRKVCVDGVSLRGLERHYHVGNGKMQPGLISGVREFGRLYEAARSSGLLRPTVDEILDATE